MTELVYFFVIASFCAISYAQIIRTYTYVPTTTTTTTSATALPQCEYESCRNTIEDLGALIHIMKSLHNNNSSKKGLTEDIILKLINALVYTSTYNHMNNLGHFPGIKGLPSSHGSGGSSGVDTGYVGKPGISGKGTGTTNVKGVDPVESSGGLKPIQTPSSVGTGGLDNVVSKDKGTKSEKSSENAGVPGILSDSNKIKRNGTKNVGNKENSSGNVAGVGNKGGVNKAGGIGNVGEVGNASDVGNVVDVDNAGGIVNTGDVGNVGVLDNTGSLTNTGAINNVGGVGNSDGVGNAGTVGNNSEIVNTDGNVGSGGNNNDGIKSTPGVSNDQGDDGSTLGNNGDAREDSNKKPDNSLIDVGLLKKNDLLDLDVAGKKILDVNAGKN